jgi:hypothetical protein
MTKVFPFHSKRPGTAIYHNDDHCDIASDIAIQDRQSGTGGLFLCEQCARISPQ